MNYESMSKAVGVAVNTIKRWVSILVTSGLIIILEPYYNNILKRAVKTPKLYFLDTGLVCHLTKWRTAEQAANGAMSGALVGTFVVAEIIKSYYNAGFSQLPIYFFRDKEGNEIDLIIEENGVLYPVEIKKTGHPEKSDIESFKKLDKVSNMKRGSGCIISMSENLRFLDENNFIVPLRLI